MIVLEDCQTLPQAALSRFPLLLSWSFRLSLSLTPLYHFFPFYFFPLFVFQFFVTVGIFLQFLGLFSPSSTFLSLFSYSPFVDFQYSKKVLGLLNVSV